MDILDRNSNILVVGLGMITGVSTSNFLVKEGFNVYVSDIKPEEELREEKNRLDERVRVLAGDQSQSILDKGFDLIVISPGVPNEIPLIQAAKDRGIEIIAEIELAYRYLQGRIIAITGTDGKSTTTTLVGEILKGIGLDTHIGGNLGTPMISFTKDTKNDSLSVVELSSFQLENIVGFKPDVAGILNVSPDHLDRYKGMDEYFEAKLRISMNQIEEDFFIYNNNDKLLARGLGGIKAKKLRFSLSDNGADAFYKQDSIFIKLNDRIERVLDISRMQIYGMHNIENAMAAILMVSSIMEKMNYDLDVDLIAETCYSFKGLPHRMEVLGEYEGRRFINDSKATTVGAVEMALKSIPDSGILILGGRTKGDDYTRLKGSIKSKIRHLMLIGESSSEFEKLFKDLPYSISESIDEAVRGAMRASMEGDVILLSPACASYDMFKSYEERGDQFVKSFKKLQNGELSWM
ncbi:MAG: UDP-N-acetylmuramoyl-L-alanine--D-glutamate ligase [Spirochaetota bacterium]|nr:UDP-N-acetylmuramoyl-L-alanine--D-glutamate ligase [Spirochaetota bacterium]